ncbi:MAG: hypothetical protein ACKO1L_00890, partial [Brachymonas sp.]
RQAACLSVPRQYSMGHGWQRDATLLAAFTHHRQNCISMAIHIQAWQLRLGILGQLGQAR